MKTLVLLTALFLSATQSWAAFITSTQTGFWQDGSTWVGGVAPGAEDHAIIANGHTVTIPSTVTVTIGSGIFASTPSIRGLGTTGTGVLVHLGSMTILGGSVLQNNATWTIGAGATVVINSTTQVNWRIGGDNLQANAQLNFEGTANSRITFQNINSTFAFVTSGLIGTGRVVADYVDFYRIGHASLPAFTFYAVDGSAYKFIWRYCTFNTCGMLDPETGIRNTTDSRVEYNVFSNSLTRNLDTAWAGTAPTTSTRTIIGNFFDRGLGDSSSGGQWYGCTIENNTIQRGIHTVGTVDAPWASFKNNVVRWDGSSQVTVWDTGANWNFWHLHNPSAQITNSRGLTGPTARNSVIQYWFVEPGNTDSTGDFFLAPSFTTPRTFTVNNNILRLSANNAKTGQFLSLLGVSTVTVAANHNTWWSTSSAGESGSLSYGETYEGYPGIISSLKSNLVVSTSSTNNGLVFSRRNENYIMDGATSTSVSHNGKYQLATGTEGVGYSDVSGGNFYIKNLGNLPTSGSFSLTVRTFDNSGSSICAIIPYNSSGTFIGNRISAALTAAGDAGFVLTPSNGSTLYNSGTALQYTLTKSGSNLTKGRITLAVNSLNSGTPIMTSPMFSSPSTVGASDVVADPQFVDDTRTIATWAVARGYSVASDYATRQADAYEALKTDTVSRTADLITWVVAGYAPTNSSFQNAGSDGVTIGALEFTSSGSGLSRNGWDFYSSDCDSFDCDEYIDQN